jgi:hypothetical protein
MRYKTHPPYTLRDGTHILESYPKPHPNPFYLLPPYDIVDTKNVFPFFYQDNTNSFFAMLKTVHETIITQVSEIIQGIDGIFKGSHQVKEKVEEITSKKFLFHTFYHPYVCEFIKRLSRDGIDGLLRREVQGLAHQV